MLKMQELLGKYNLEDLPEEHQKNLAILLERVNKIREKWAQPMKVTSGYRSNEDQIRIYHDKGITDPNRIPMASKHLSGQAVDVFDPRKELQMWVQNNVQILEQVELWCENFSATHDWVHFQCVPPKSGKRFFLP